MRVYVDAGISGKRMDTRKELLAALASLKKGMALVSYSLSRLARSTKDALAIGEAVEKKKADLVSLTLALKAQAQCRATLEALAEIKNPMPYIKQANIAHGPQQVNFNSSTTLTIHTSIA